MNEHTPEPTSPITPAGTMDCTDFRSLVSGFVDGALVESERHGAERHLVVCAACRTMADRIERIDLDLRALAGAWGADDAFPAHVEAAILDRSTRPRSRERWLRVGGGLGWAAAAAIGIAWTLSGVLPGRLGVHPVDSDMNGGSQQVAFPHIDRNDRMDGDERASGDLARARKDSGQRTNPDAACDSGLGGGSTMARDAEAGSSTRAHEPQREPNRLAAESDAATAPANGYARSSPRSGVGMAQSPSDRSTQVTPGRPSINPILPWRDGLMRDVASARAADSDTVFAASLLLDRLSRIDPANLEEVERIRYVITYDQVIDRLAETRRRLDPADRPLVTGAECFLIRLLRGPVEESVIVQMQIDLKRIGLHDKLETLSDRIEVRRTF